MRTGLAITLLSVFAGWPGLQVRLPHTADPLAAVVIPAPEKLGFSNAVGALLFDARLPGGVAESRPCQGTPNPVEVRGGRQTLRVALAQLELQRPGFVTVVRGGTVNILPRLRVPRLLQVELPRFDFVGDGRDALSQLESTRQFTSARSELGLHQYFFGGLTSSAPAETVRLHLRNATLLDALNALVKGMGAGFWRYSEMRCGGRGQLTIDLFRGNPRLQKRTGSHRGAVTGGKQVRPDISLLDRRAPAGSEVLTGRPADIAMRMQPEGNLLVTGWIVNHHSGFLPADLDCAKGRARVVVDPGGQIDKTASSASNGTISTSF